MLLRTCPGCGDFYADDAPPFCPSDGSPLADVDPRGEAWEEGARVVGEKSQLIQRRARRLKLRRVLTALMTMTVTTMVVFVVMANAVIYLAPGTEAPAALASATKPSTPTPMPVRGPAYPAMPPAADGTVVIPFVSADDPTPDGAATPDPSRTSTPTPPPGDTSTAEEAESPTPTPTTEVTTTVEESPITPTPTPTVTTTVVVTTRTPPPPPPTPTPPTCTGDDKRALRGAIAARSSRAWEDAIGRDREEIAGAYTRRGASRVSVNLFGPVVYNVSFTKACAPVSANAVYMWSVRWEVERAPDRPENRNQLTGLERHREPRERQTTGGERKMLRTLTFACSADGGGGWRCP